MLEFDPIVAELKRQGIAEDLDDWYLKWGVTKFQDLSKLKTEGLRRSGRCLTKPIVSSNSSLFSIYDLNQGASERVETEACS